jgi:chromosomal replication initiator protein
MELANQFISPVVYAGLGQKHKADYLRDTSNNETKRAKIIIEEICMQLKIDESDIVTQSRKRGIVEARQICMHFLRSMTKLTLKEIGALLGNRDHATVIYGLQIVDDMITTNKFFRHVIQKISRVLNN